MVVGAYLFGGVTMLQFAFQGMGISISPQFMAMTPYLATILVLVLISRNPAWIRLNVPASLGKPFRLKAENLQRADALPRVQFFRATVFLNFIVLKRSQRR